MYEIGNRYYSIFLFLHLIYVLYSLYFLRSRTYLRKYKPSIPVLLAFTMTLICVFAATGDYWTYRSWYDDGVSGDIVEPGWAAFKLLIPDNYDVFRFVVWGVGVCLFWIICKLSRVDIALTLCLFGLFYTGLYCYGRASIATMFVVLGFVIVYKKPFHVIVRYLLFIILVFMGLMIHRSMVLLLPAMIIAPYIKINKKTLIRLIILYPFLSVLFSLFFFQFSMLFFANAYIGEKAEGILTSSSVSVSFLEAIFWRLPILVLFALSIIYSSSKVFNNKVLEKINSAGFFIIYMAMLLIFVSSGNTTMFFYRMLNMAYPLMLISITYTLVQIKDINRTAFLLSLLMLVDLILTIRIYFIVPDIIKNQINERYYLYY